MVESGVAPDRRREGQTMADLDRTGNRTGNGNGSTATASVGAGRGAGVSLNFATDWKYAPAPESAKVTIQPRYELFIDGKFIAPANGEYFDTINPATERKLAEVAQADGEDVDRAVKAARRGYEKTWSKLPAKERGKYIYRIARMIQERGRELAI